MSDTARNHLYRVVSQDERRGRPQIEFEAPSVTRAIDRLQRICGFDEVELFENDRSLGRLRLAGQGGFWIVSANTAAVPG